MVNDDDELHERTQRDLDERAEAAREREEQKKTEAFKIWVDVQAEWQSLVGTVKKAKTAGITDPKVVKAIKTLGRQLSKLLEKLELKPTDAVTAKDMANMDDILSGKAAKRKGIKKKETKNESED